MTDPDFQHAPSIRPEFQDPLRHSIQTMVRYSCEKHFRGNTRDSQDALAADILALIRPVVDELAQYRKLPVEAICRCPLPHGPMTKSILDHIKESAEALG